jgi:hypothetical protein
MKTMRLFGYVFNKNELLKRIGTMHQMCGARESILPSGKSEGVRVIDVRTGSGFAYTLIPTRGLDVYSMEYKGVPVGWLSKVGLCHPAYYEKDDFLKYFHGGILYTCGMCNAGLECEYEGRTFGVHGNVSRIPAEELLIMQDWDDNNRYRIEVRGKIQESRSMEEHLVLNRSFTTYLGSKCIELHDIINNEMSSELPIMLLYHINIGFPIVSEDSYIIADVERTEPWIDGTRQGDPAKSLQMQKPDPRFSTQVFVHTLNARDDGLTGAAVINRKMKIGFYIKYNAKKMPFFSQWKMMGESDYVIGFEPGNCIPEGRVNALKNERLEFLSGGASKRFYIELGILDGPAEIQTFEKWLYKNGK